MKIERKSNRYELTEREQVILHHIIRQYIQTANPIGSRTVSKQSQLKLSAASIRNIMSDLEEQGFIGHPHTSAGRVPTDKGYRFYVDTMEPRVDLQPSDQAIIRGMLEQHPVIDTDLLMRDSTHILSRISELLAIISSPHIGNGRLQRIQLIQLASDRLLVVLSISSGFVKTILFEIDGETPRESLDQITALLNERLAGLTLSEIRDSFGDRMKETSIGGNGIIELFIRSTDRLFSDQLDDSRLYIDGMHTIMQQPEFDDPEKLRNVVDLLENRNVIVHVLESLGDEGDVQIKIGSEIEDEKLRDYSIVASPYHFGPLSGTISIVGPRRMNYPRMIALVDYLSEMISSHTRLSQDPLK